MSETPMRALSRQAATCLSRRSIAQGVTIGGLASVIAALSGAEAKKRKRRKKKRKKPPTCAEQCPNQEACFSRPVGPPLCGDVFSRGVCVPCSSDQDCIEAQNPYCLTSLTQASNNQSRRFSDCGDYVVGLCTSIGIIT